MAVSLRNIGDDLLSATVLGSDSSGHLANLPESGKLADRVDPARGMGQHALVSGSLLIVANLDEHGGLQNRVRRVASELTRLGPVTIVTWRTRGTPFKENKPDGVRILRVPSLVPWNRDRGRIVEMLNTAVSVFTALCAALGTARSWDVVYGSGLDPEGLVAGVVGRSLRRRVIVDTWLVGPRGNVARLERSTFASLWKRLLRKATILAETEEVVRELKAAGFDAPNIKRVDWGVAIADYPLVTEQARAAAKERLGLTEPRVVAYWGRIDLLQKRLDVLLEAWARIPTEGSVLLIAGDGPDTSAVRALAAATSNVRFLAWRSDVKDLIAAADIFVLPTEFETGGRSVYEGLASGLPGVVSATSGFVEVDPEGVILVENEAEAWARALARLLTDNELRTALAEKGHRWVVAERDFMRAAEEVLETFAGTS